MNDKKSEASTEPFRIKEIHKLSASVRQEGRVGIFEEDLMDE